MKQHNQLVTNISSLFCFTAMNCTQLFNLRKDYFKKIFAYGPFLKSLLTLLQYFFCFVF